MKLNVVRSSVLVASFGLLWPVPVMGNCSEWAVTVDVDYAATQTTAWGKGVLTFAIQELCLSDYYSFVNAKVRLYRHVGNPYPQICSGTQSLFDEKTEGKGIFNKKIAFMAATAQDQAGCNAHQWSASGFATWQNEQKNGESACKCADCTGGGPGGGGGPLSRWVPSDAGL